MELSFKKVIYLIIATTPILDALNGFFTMFSNKFASQIIPNLRLIFIIIFILGLFQLNEMMFKNVILFLFLFTSQILLVSLYNDGDITIVVSNLTLAVRLMYFFTLTVYLYELKEIKDSFKSFIPYIKFYVYSMPLLIIVPSWLGIGRLTYASSSFGNSGFFIATNASNAALIVSLFINVIFLITQQNGTNVAFLFFQIYALLIQGTKTGIFVGVLVVVLLFFKVIKSLLKPPYSHLQIIVFILFVCIIMLSLLFLSDWLPSIIKIFYGYLEPLLNRQYYLQKAVGGNMISVLFSGRLGFANRIFEHIISLNNPIVWLFGLGTAYIVNVVGHIAEMDLFDVFFSYGLLGVLATYGITLVILWRLWRYKSLYLKFSILTILAYSIFAGHVMVDILSSTGLILLLLATNKDIEKSP